MYTIKFFTAPYCVPCVQIKNAGVTDSITAAGHKLIEVDVSVTMGRDEAAKYGIIATPAMVVLDANGGVVATYKDGATQIMTELPKLLAAPPEKDYTYYYIAGGVTLLYAAIYFSRKKKRYGRIGKIHQDGTTLCNDYKRSTTKTAGACSYHRGVKTFKADLPNYRAAKPNSYRGKSATLPTRKRKKK